VGIDYKLLKRLSRIILARAYFDWFDNPKYDPRYGLVMGV